MTRFTTQPLLFLLSVVLVASIWGCGSLEPTSPAGKAFDGRQESLSAKADVMAIEGGWQTAELFLWDPESDLPRTTSRQSVPTGQLRYHIVGMGVFEGEIGLNWMEPDHEYLLTVIGKPDMPGSAEQYYNAGVVFYDIYAPEPYTGWPTAPGGTRGEEEYCDFALVIARQDGSVRENFAVTLPPGTYQVTFAVKDARMWTHYAETGTFETKILYNDDVNFKIISRLQRHYN